MGHGLEQARVYFIIRAVVHSLRRLQGNTNTSGKEGFACIGYNKYVFTINKRVAIRHACLMLKESLFAPNKLQNSSRGGHSSENIIPQLLAGLVSG